ncbi:conserved hypothetical protein [Uncinocarpus reesii 1704]|uniref:DUF7492 domain-containing protein n=1 Tax=Uncinocarpus reesii (strain UAMH 1704) TaxID=336963 RepID=C4JJA1_UNCRE|nr:uncharacterized protein UREG_01708 [Uncinocarpus reesii 1704]EEP76859.1 conserved hypothetical protein [Uncinocarpus reesii 1704]
MFTAKALMAFLFSVSMTPLVAGHSWVEQLMNIAPNGTFVGDPGYPRGNIRRGTPEFNDPAMTYLLPPNTRPAGSGLQPGDNICKETQRKLEQTQGSPRLKASPGAAIALRFQENGHVTLPDAQPGKPKNRGYVYVYGTTDPRPDDKILSIHKVWNSAGTGGDRRGMLLSRQNFDDGRCYQINDKPISKLRQAKFPHEANQLMGADMWCQQDIALPQNVPVGKPYTLYWVWDWPTAPSVDPGLPKGKLEIYTTCMDIDIIEKPLSNKLAIAQGGEGYVKGQPLNNAALPSQLAQLNNAMVIPTAASTGFRTAAVQLTKSAPNSSGVKPTASSTMASAAVITIIPPFKNSTTPLNYEQNSKAPGGTTPVPTQTMAQFRFRRDGVELRRRA